MARLSNDQWERFCTEILIDNNGTEAAKRAGYKASNTRSQASKLLARPEIASRIEELREERSKRTQITTDMVLEELKIVAHSSIADYTIDDTGNLALADGVPAEAIRAVSGLDVTIITDKDGKTTRRVKFRLWNKNEAVKMEGQHLGMFAERIDINNLNVDLSQLSNEELEQLVAGESLASILKRRAR